MLCFVKNRNATAQSTFYTKITALDNFLTKGKPFDYPVNLQCTHCTTLPQYHRNIKSVTTFMRRVPNV